MKSLSYIYLLLFICLSNHSKIENSTLEEEQFNPSRTIKILSLGDSYTIGANVCETCRFPEQLKKRIKKNLKRKGKVNLNIIARSGWTTSDLLSGIDQTKLANDQDIVTLLIGVNNQYRRVPFSVYEKEFPELVTKAITLAQGDKSKIIIVSIPDYAYTFFGQNTGMKPSDISAEIDKYNMLAKNYCETNDISFVNITPISRESLDNPDLVAYDQLHPSKLAYARFVKLILPIALEKLEL